MRSRQKREAAEVHVFKLMIRLSVGKIKRQVLPCWAAAQCFSRRAEFPGSARFSAYVIHLSSTETLRFSQGFQEKLCKQLWEPLWSLAKGNLIEYHLLGVCKKMQPCQQIKTSEQFGYRRCHWAEILKKDLLLMCVGTCRRSNMFRCCHE